MVKLKKEQQQPAGLAVSPQSTTMANRPFVSSVASRRRLTRTRSASDLIRDRALRRIANPDDTESPGDSSDDGGAAEGVHRLHISPCKELPPPAAKTAPRQPPKVHNKKKTIPKQRKQSAARLQNHKMRQHLFFTPEHTITRDSSDDEDDVGEGSCRLLHISPGLAHHPSSNTASSTKHIHSPQINSNKNKGAKQKRAEASRLHNHKTRQQLFFTPEHDEWSRSTSSSRTAKRSNTQNPSRRRTESTASTTTGSSSLPAQRSLNGGQSSSVSQLGTTASPNEQESSVPTCNEDELKGKETEEKNEEESSSSSSVPEFLECEEPTDDESAISSVLDCSQTVYCYGELGGTPPRSMSLIQPPSSYHHHPAGLVPPSQQPAMMVLPGAATTTMAAAAPYEQQQQHSWDHVSLPSSASSSSGRFVVPPFSASAVLLQHQQHYQYQTSYRRGGFAGNDIRYHHHHPPGERLSLAHGCNDPYWQSVVLQQQQEGEEEDEEEESDDEEEVSSLAPLY